VVGAVVSVGPQAESSMVAISSVAKITENDFFILSSSKWVQLG
jgi:hypothetical protein